MAARKTGEIDLPVVFQRDLGEHGQGLAELADIDACGIAGNKPFLLQFLDPHQAGAGRQIDELRQFDIGNAPVLLQFVEDLDVDLIQFHAHSFRHRAKQQTATLPQLQDGGNPPADYAVNKTRKNL